MTEYDEIVIREKLQRLAGHGIDDDLAYANLLRNVRAARRRRAAEMIGGLGAVCVLAVGLMSLRAEPGRRLVPTGGNVDDVALVESTAVPTTNAVTTTATAIPTTAAATTTTEPATTTTVPETTTTLAPEPTVAPTQENAPTQPPGSTTQTTTKSTTKATTPATTATTVTTAPKPPAVASARETKVALYGSITVTLSNGQLSLESKTVVAGATADVRGWGPESVVVRFTAPTGRSTITARTKDGVILFSVDERSGDGDEPDVTMDDGDGKANGGTGGDDQDHRDRGDWNDWGSRSDGSGGGGRGGGGSDDETPATGTTPTTDD